MVLYVHGWLDNVILGTDGFCNEDLLVVGIVFHFHLVGSSCLSNEPAGSNAYS